MIPFGWPLWIVLIFLFLYGAVLGSFLNVCIYRIPQHDRFWPSLLGLWSPPSYCPRCGNRIPRRDNLPIIGWVK
ncbi:MAG: prepilin peptidase, partial [Planctomycetes bacterium]|nr:prepilin peptidase [Planctomycetota bacterium]